VILRLLARRRLAADPVRAQKRALARGRPGPAIALDPRPVLDAWLLRMPRRKETLLFLDSAPIRTTSRARAIQIRPGDITSAAERLSREPISLLWASPPWAMILLDAVERAGGRPIRDLWPRWRGLVHQGVAIAPFAEAFHRCAGSGIATLEVLVDPEAGLIAVQDRPRDRSLAVVARSDRLFDFVDRVGRRRRLWEVEAGMQYFGPGGMVRFTSTAPPRLVPVASDLDCFGETLSREAVDRAWQEAARRVPCGVAAYAVLPRYPRADHPRGRHLWIMECAPPPRDLAELARSLDRALCASSASYAALRAHGGPLAAPRVRLVRTGAFSRRWASGVRRPLVLERDQAAGLWG